MQLFSLLKIIYMKKIFLAISLFIYAFSNAQIKSGILKYEMITNLAGAAKSSDKEIPEAILAMFPKEIKSQKQLRFTETKSIYENIAEKKEKSNEENEPQEATGGMSIQIKTVGNDPKEKTFTDFEQNRRIELKNFFGKDFLVTTDSINKIQWKPTGKQKIILNYPCYEAITIGDVKGKQDTISAWYTPAIASKSGPMGFCNLPGMIMQIQMGQTITINAIEVIEQEIKDADIVKPTDGKKVTAAEFKEIQDKKLKEMGVEKGKPRVIFHSSSEMQ